MSNRVRIHRTEFVELKTGERTLGVRIGDDHDSTYIDYLETLPDDDLELLEEIASQYDDTVTGILSFCLEVEKGVSIDDTFYDYDEIKEVLERHYN